MSVKQKKEILKILGNGGYSYDELLKAYSGSIEDLNKSIDSLVRQKHVKELRFINNNVYFLFNAKTFLEFQTLDYRPLPEEKHTNVNEKDWWELKDSKNEKDWCKYKANMKDYYREKIIEFLDKGSLTSPELKKKLSVSDMEDEDIYKDVLRELRRGGEIKEVKIDHNLIFYRGDE